MGEIRVIKESILGNFAEKEVYYDRNSHLPIMENNACLHSFCSDKLKYVHNKPFDYNKCKFNSAFEVDLIVESINGEKKYDC